MPYKIAMLSVHTSPLDLPGRTKDAGGMNVYMRELARALAQRNIIIDIFARSTNRDIPRIVHISPQVRVIHIQAGPPTAIHKDALYQYLPEFARNIDEFKQREDQHYDLIHSHYWLSGLAGLKLSQLWSVPHVIMFHTLGQLKQVAMQIEGFLQPGNPQEREPALRIMWEQKLMQQAGCVIAATTDERAQMIHSFGIEPQKVKVIPCGVDVQLFAPHNQDLAREQLSLPTNQPIVLFAGRLDPFKGPDLLLQAASKMKAKAHVVIVGGDLSGDKDLQTLQALARKLDMSQRVHFCGAQAQQELPWYYSAADVTVVPSYHETFGLAAVESLACATPVVATRAGGLTTVVQHGRTGFLVPRSPETFAESIEGLLCNHALRLKMAAHARDSVLKYSWSEVAREVNMLYAELVGETACVVQ